MRVLGLEGCGDHRGGVGSCDLRGARNKPRIVGPKLEPVSVRDLVASSGKGGFIPATVRTAGSEMVARGRTVEVGALIEIIVQVATPSRTSVTQCARYRRDDGRRGGARRTRSRTCRTCGRISRASGHAHHRSSNYASSTDHCATHSLGASCGYLERRPLHQIFSALV